MNEKIVVFTDSELLYNSVIRCVSADNSDVRMFSIKNIKEASKINPNMVILDLYDEGDFHYKLMRIFHIKYFIPKSILVFTDKEQAKYLLNLFSFGVEDYVIKAMDENSIRTKIYNILRFQKWLDKHSYSISAESISMMKDE